MAAAERGDTQGMQYGGHKTVEGMRTYVAGDGDTRLANSAAGFGGSSGLAQLRERQAVAAAPTPPIESLPPPPPAAAPSPSPPIESLAPPPATPFASLPPPPATPASTGQPVHFPPTPVPSLASKLAQLQEALASGLITEGEFNTIRARALSSF